jgi:fibronectin type 3 domain-containing protein
VVLSAAPASPVLVTLQSNSKYLTIPPSVTVATGSTTANFKATALAVGSSLTATITASLGGVSVSNPIQLNAPSVTTQHVVNLSWSAPSSTTDLAGYHIYRSIAGASIFQLLNSAPGTQSSYADNTVASGESYDYEVTSMSSSGAESNPSNITTASIP